MGRRRRAIRAAALLGAGLAIAGSARAGELLALAHARSGAVAIAAAGPDIAAASAAARAACGPDCDVLAVAPAGTCLALARGPGANLGWALRDGADAARAAALGACGRGGAAAACTVVAARCLPAVASRRIVGPPRRIDDPERAIVVIHSHGSLPTREADPCEMDRVNAPFGVPSVIDALEGETIAGRRVVVDGFCTPTRIGPMDPNTGLRTPKVIPRMREIAARAAAYVAAGVPAQQILLSGHSAGGWASLLVERERPDLIAGVIAFAPAAFGVAATRPPPVEAARRRRYADLTATAALRALVFGFAGDAFETADDLAVLARVPGVAFVAVPADAIDGRPCAFAPHQRVRDPCFAETQAERIRRFIAAQVGA
ncbi:MAG: DUF4189 domain-containing protein, partial [Alphaproteobacteria bacterium]|nr:DUF4189 domain-containing protein [Alphaproteobacteria bacterium]